MAFPDLEVQIGFLALSDAESTAPYLTFNDTVLTLDVGQFGGDYYWQDVSTDVRSLSITRGRQRQIEAFGAGSCSLELDNNEGDYDPDNPESIYYSGGTTTVLPMRPIRIVASWDDIEYPLFYGYLDAIVPQYAPGQFSDAWVTITATDGMKILQNQVASGAMIQEYSGERIGHILDSVNWPLALRDIDTGEWPIRATTLAATAAQEIQTTVDSEYGRWYFGADGSVVFESRSSRITQTSVSTWSDTDVPVAVSSDSFNRVNNSAAIGVTDGGGTLDPLTWTTQQGTCGISSNQAYASALSGGKGLATVDLAAADVDLTLTLATANLGGLMFRFVDTSNYWVWAAVTGSSILYKMEAGSLTQVGVLTVGAADGDVVRVVAVGSTIEVYRNGSLLLTTTSSFNSTATLHGLYCENTAVRLNDWSASTMSSILYSQLGRVMDDDLIRNRITVQNVTGTAQTLTDQTSIDQYQERSFSSTNLLLTSNGDANQLAHVYLYNGKQLAGTRFDAVEFQPVTDIPAGDPADLWPEVLGREISDRVTVVISPPYVTPMSIGAYVEGVSHQITTTPQNWTTTFHASRGNPQPFLVFNDPTLGTIGTTNTFGY